MAAATNLRFTLSPSLSSLFTLSNQMQAAPIAAMAAHKAVAVLKGDSKVEGVVTLTQEDDGPTTVNVRVTGLAPGLHGFDLHEYGDTTNGCMSTGLHFNPNNMTHGAPQDEEWQRQQLWTHSCCSKPMLLSHKLCASVHACIPLSGPNAVIGRAFVVHELEDDLGKGGHELSLTTGNAGGRLACGQCSSQPNISSSYQSWCCRLDSDKKLFMTPVWYCAICCLLLLASLIEPHVTFRKLCKQQVLVK
ncbi:hypothetical protein REPUB_Repub05bG0160400 [Reevesia pubescens]